MRVDIKISMLYSFYHMIFVLDEIICCGWGDIVNIIMQSSSIKSEKVIINSLFNALSSNIVVFMKTFIKFEKLSILMIIGTEIPLQRKLVKIKKSPKFITRAYMKNVISALSCSYRSSELVHITWVISPII